MSDKVLPTVLFTVLLSTIIFSPLFGDDPDSTVFSGNNLYVKTQFAGNIGLLSVGIGKEYLDGKLTVDLNYGYLPACINGTSVSTFAIKPAFRIKDFSIAAMQSSLSTGICFTYSATRNTYNKYPDYFPEDYYLGNAMHANPFLRISLFHFPSESKSGRLSVYSELGTMEYQIWYAMKNKEVSFIEICNLCFGLTYRLK